jgi:hypothetical protein
LPCVWTKKKGKQNISFLAPPLYERHIKKPINGEVISIGKRRETKGYDASCCGIETKSSALSVTVNVGRKNGVTKNLLFLLVDVGDNFSQVLKITKVRENTSQAIIYRQLDENGKEFYEGDYNRETDSSAKIPFPPVRIGTKITTSPIK